MLLSLWGHFSIWSIVSMILSMALVLLVCLPIHECAHGWMANKLGDHTAYYQKRITLNPLKHIDPIGAVSMLLIGFGWARPVPVNPRNFQDPKKDMAITALAGPASNLLMAMIILFLQNAFLTIWISVSAPINAVFSVIYDLLYSAAAINISLGIFNLIPLPPLDGSRILAAFLPDRYYYKLQQYEQVLTIFVFIILAAGLFSGPLSKVVQGVYNAFNWLTGLPFVFFWH